MNPNKITAGDICLNLNLKRISNNNDNHKKNKNSTNPRIIQILIKGISDLEKSSQKNTNQSYLLSKSWLDEWKKCVHFDDTKKKNDLYNPKNMTLSEYDGKISNKLIYENSFGFYKFLDEDSFISITPGLFEQFNKLYGFDEIISSKELICVFINNLFKIFYKDPIIIQLKNLKESIQKKNEKKKELNLLLKSDLCFLFNKCQNNEKIKEWCNILKIKQLKESDINLKIKDQNSIECNIETDCQKNYNEINLLNSPEKSVYILGKEKIPIDRLEKRKKEINLKEDNQRKKFLPNKIFNKGLIDNFFNSNYFLREGTDPDNCLLNKKKKLDNNEEPPKKCIELSGIDNYSQPEQKKKKNNNYRQ